MNTRIENGSLRIGRPARGSGSGRSGGSVPFALLDRSLWVCTVRFVQAGNNPVGEFIVYQRFPLDMLADN